MMIFTTGLAGIAIKVRFYTNTEEFCAIKDELLLEMMDICAKNDGYFY